MNLCHTSQTKKSFYIRNSMKNVYFKIEFASSIGNLEIFLRTGIKIELVIAM